MTTASSRFSHRLIPTALVVTGLLTVAAVVSTVLITLEHKRAQARGAMKAAAMETAEFLSREAVGFIITADFETLLHLVQAKSEKRGETTAFITDPAGKIVAHPDSTQLGQTRDDDLHARSVQARQAVARVRPEEAGETFEAAAPIMAAGRVVGVARVDRSLRAPAPDFREVAALVAPPTIVLLVVEAALLYLFLNSVVRPILSVSSAIADVASGNYGRRVERPAVEEIGLLAESFNRMAEQLQRTDAALLEEKRKLEHALAERTKDFFRTHHSLLRVFESSPSAIFTTDLRGRITAANPATCALTGLSARELIGRPSGSFYANTEELREVQAALRREGRVPNREISIRRPDGTIRTVLVTLSTIVSDRHRPIGMLGIGTDVTEKQEVERRMIQSERLAAIGQLIAGVAHELNNPLTGIMGYSQLLLSRPDASSVRGPLDRINREAIRMQKIVSNLLAFSRSHDPEWKLVGLNGLLETTIELVAYEFKVNNIRVETDFDPDLPMTLGDFHRIEQVFVNLITNALQAMADSHVGGALFLKTRQAAENGENWLRVNVKDDGPGIHPDHVARVFDPFFTTKPPGRGTGLGLALAQQIIQEHGGRIRVSSEPMKGTTFTVDLPLRTAVPPEGESADEPASEGGSGGGQDAQKKAILVADDEPSILSLLYDTLKEKGYAVETAPSGNAALRKLKTRSFDLILTDVKMPGLSGIELYDRVRKDFPGLESRIVFMSGDTVTEATRVFLGDRRDRCLPKPFGPADVYAFVARFLDPEASGRVS